jgi:hypothetical protein
LWQICAICLAPINASASGLLGRQPAKSGCTTQLEPTLPRRFEVPVTASFLAFSSSKALSIARKERWVCRDRADQFCELSASYGTKPGQKSLPPWPGGTLALQPGPRFQQIGDGDGGESPIPDKSGTGTGERPRPRPLANRGRTPRPRPRTNRGRGRCVQRGRGPGCPRPASESIPKHIRRALGETKSTKSGSDHGEACSVWPGLAGLASSARPSCSPHLRRLPHCSNGSFSPTAPIGLARLGALSS